MRAGWRVKHAVRADGALNPRMRALCGRAGWSEFLHVDEALVVAAKGDELVVGAALHYPALVHHTNQVGIADGGQAVGYDQCRAVFHKSVESLLHKLFALAVERRGGLVKYKHGRILKNGTSYRQTLTLTA